MKFKKLAVALCAAALSLTVMSVTAFAADAGVKIDAAHFPDEKFRESILDGLDKDKNGYLSTKEAAEATSLQCESEGITSLKGIEYLTELTLLDCSNNQLTELDVSKNTKLEWLNCGGNALTKLDVSKNTKLETLSCGGNALTKLDVSKNTALDELLCSSNQLTKLDVSNNTALAFLNCYINQLTELDLSNNPELVYLDCEVCKLKKLNVRKNTKLETLYCDVNQLTELDVSGCAKLYNLDCGGNQLTKLDVSKNTALAYLYCNSNQLTSLDMSGCKELRYLYCYNNKLAELNISGNPNIIKVYTKGEDDNYRPLDAIEGILVKSYYDNSDVENAKIYYIIWDKATKIYTKSTSHTPHTWDSGKVTKAATYGATGVKTYTCTVCGAKKTSSIAKKTVKKLTAKTTYTCTTNAVRINWNKLSGVTGYKIFRYDDAKKKWVAVKAVYDPNATNYKISGLKAGKVYKFRVKAFVKENGKFYFGESCSTISTATRPNTTTVTKANKTSTAVRLFWKKTTCTGYRILRYDSAKKKWVRVTAVGSSATTQYKISGLKKNTTYKFKVQPYVKVGSKVIDGAASAVFTVKTSK